MADRHQQSIPALFPSLRILLNPEAWAATTNQAEWARDLSPACPGGSARSRFKPRQIIC